MDYKVEIREDEQIKMLIQVNKELRSQLRYEKSQRLQAEKELFELKHNMEISETEKFKRHRRTKAEMEAIKPKEYSPIKIDGKPKAQSSEPIRSYADFKAIQDYYLWNDKYRDYALWTCGVCFGLRASDITQLKWKDVMTEPCKYRERVRIIEKKTSKLNNLLITEAIIKALNFYIDRTKMEIVMDNYIFGKVSAKRNSPIGTVRCWQIIQEAVEACKIPIHAGSHTMRKSFSNIAFCLDKSTIDMNSIVKIQGLLNQSSPLCTMRYLNTLNVMYDNARTVVSDFCLGKLDSTELVAGVNNNESELNEIIEKLDALLSSQTIDKEGE